MAFNRSWDTVAETWEAVSTTWDFAADTGTDNLSLGLAETGEVTVFISATDSVSVSVSETTDTAVSVEKTSSDSVGVSLSETVEASVSIGSSDSVTLSASETAEELLGSIDSEDFIQFGIAGKLDLLIEDWPQSVVLPPSSWAKSPSADSVWTKVPGASPSTWS